MIWLFPCVLLGSVPLLAILLWRRSSTAPLAPQPQAADPSLVPSPFLGTEVVPLMPATAVLPVPAVTPVPIAPPAADSSSSPTRSMRTSSADVFWMAQGQSVDVRGRTIPGGLFYLGTPRRSRGPQADPDPSWIDPSLPVDFSAPKHDGSSMGYWPSYSRISPSCRAAYLDWLASERCAPDTYIGYVFLFFYGLERRALIDGQDHEVIRSEVRRLLTIYGNNSSFRSYATQFIAATMAEHLEAMDEATVCSELSSIASNNLVGLAMLLAWYHRAKQPLPFDIAALVAEAHEDSRRSVVVHRSRQQLLDLFRLRYQEAFGAGITVQAAARHASLDYHPASSGLVSLRARTIARLPDVLGKPVQFKKLVEVWNACVDDLKQFSSASRKSGVPADQAMTAAMWEALPADLRTQRARRPREVPHPGRRVAPILRLLREDARRLLFPDATRDGDALRWSLEPNRAGRDARLAQAPRDCGPGGGRPEHFGGG